MSKQLDISIEEINKLLKEKQSKINNMENITNNSREKLKKINNKLDKHEKELLNIHSMIQEEEIELINIDNIQNPNIDEIFSKLEKIQESLRKTRISLATIIRNK